MPRIGTPLSPSATRVLLCGSGELGKEVVIELQRLGVEVIAVDRYANAPAMQVAHRSHVLDMLDGAALRAVIELEQPHYIVPEIEAIATATLVELEGEGFTVIPSARAAQLTMNREGIRRLAAEELCLPTSPYHFSHPPYTSPPTPPPGQGGYQGGREPPPGRAEAPGPGQSTAPAAPRPAGGGGGDTSKNKT